MEGTLGEVRMFGGNFPPLNWAFCNGALMPISQYDALFYVIGTTYGGNGQTDFALPDLRGRLPVGTGQGPGLSNVSLGQLYGIENTALNLNTMPQHNHMTFASSDQPAQNTAAGGLLASNNRAVNPPMTNIYAAPNNTVSMQATSAVGANQPFSVLQPVLGMNCVICVNGVFPPRD